LVVNRYNVLTLIKHQCEKEVLGECPQDRKVRNRRQTCPLCTTHTNTWESPHQRFSSVFRSQPQSGNHTGASLCSSPLEIFYKTHQLIIRPFVSYFLPLCWTPRCKPDRNLRCSLQLFSPPPLTPGLPPLTPTPTGAQSPDNAARKRAGGASDETRELLLRRPSARRRPRDGPDGGRGGGGGGRCCRASCEGSRISHHT